MDIPYEAQAIHNESPPKEMNGIELLAYFSACYMYEQYHSNKITREDGSKLKRRIVEALQSATEKEAKYSGIWQRIENISVAYVKNPTTENADKFYAAVYNLPDDWRLKR